MKSNIVKLPVPFNANANKRPAMDTIFRAVKESNNVIDLVFHPEFKFSATAEMVMA